MEQNLPPRMTKDQTIFSSTNKRIDVTPPVEQKIFGDLRISSSVIYNVHSKLTYLVFSRTVQQQTLALACIARQQNPMLETDSCRSSPADQQEQWETPVAVSMFGIL